MPAPELVLAVFLHGFKGNSDTFADFPQRLQHVLTQSGIDLQPIVYPSYDTRGELVTAVDNHVTWLTNLVAERQAEYREKGGKGPVRVVLLGHSMGGLVIADTLLATLSSASLPILGLIAFDSPLLGLNPKVFKSTFDKALDLASTGQAALAALGAGYGLFKSATSKESPSLSGSGSNTPRSSSKAATSTKGKDKEVAVPLPAESTSATPGGNWFSYVAAAGLAGTAAAFGAAWYNRDVLAQHWSWATSHLSFVGELWKLDELEKRLEEVVAAKEKGVGFYTLIPASNALPSRTFLVLPHSPSLRSHFTPSTNTRAADEIRAHVEMFDRSDGYYQLGSETARLIHEWVEEARRGRMGWWKGDGTAGAGAGAGKGKRAV
ncbi:SPOSA6832_00751 [Sporobolomyces salmonicolor]|uniref:SPOSA6832_00751-mRNA-1:cds n=1 Tax=Sporidiobolus salmonicolor TaxID=5005 RepID=A0A0D6EGV7_SPOSA|nr:SPOSA6832_00751 [Sporobolomyces salmonicolor]